MSDYVKFAKEAGDAYLASLAEGQKAFLNAVETFQSNVPAFPSNIPAYAPQAPAAAFASSFPTLQEVTEANFNFATKLLKQQKDFADKLLAKTSAAPSAPAAG